MIEVVPLHALKTSLLMNNIRQSFVKKLWFNGNDCDVTIDVASRNKEIKRLKLETPSHFKRQP